MFVCCKALNLNLRYCLNSVSHLDPTHTITFVTNIQVLSWTLMWCGVLWITLWGYCFFWGGGGWGRVMACYLKKQTEEREKKKGPPRGGGGTNSRMGKSIDSGLLSQPCNQDWWTDVVTFITTALQLKLCSFKMKFWLSSTKCNKKSNSWKVTREER